jgi:hypothetical protein
MFGMQSTDDGDPVVNRRSWRHWFRVVHRDVGYLIAGLTLIYAVSGLAVNHIDDWNPNYSILQEQRTFAPIEDSTRMTEAELSATLSGALDLDATPQRLLRTGPGKAQLFYDGVTVEADLASGVAIVERVSDRPLLRDANFLHLNHPKGVWTYLADLYALTLIGMVITGVFLLRGRQGLSGRGKWLIGVGTALPLVALWLLRWS